MVNVFLRFAAFMDVVWRMGSSSIGRGVLRGGGNTVCPQSIMEPLSPFLPLAANFTAANCATATVCTWPGAQVWLKQDISKAKALCLYVCQALACARNLAWSSGVHQSAVWASTQETQHKRETKEGKNGRSGQLIAVHATRLLANFYIMCFGLSAEVRY